MAQKRLPFGQLPGMGRGTPLEPEPGGGGSLIGPRKRSWEGTLGKSTRKPSPEHQARRKALAEELRAERKQERAAAPRSRVNMPEYAQRVVMKEYGVKRGRPAHEITKEEMDRLLAQAKRKR
jgi:hypothetical protein